MITLTADEQRLLHGCHALIGFVVATPAAGITHLRQSQASGSGREFSYNVTRDALTGEWCRYEVLERTDDGLPSLMRFDPPHRQAAITWTRLGKWAASLPSELRARAITAWRVYPVNTRNLGDLQAIVHEAIDLSAPVTTSAQLELFTESLVS